jgi:hypothetical protein
VRRVVVAITALLVTLGGAVIVSYLFLFSASADRASRAVPADAALYVNVYLQPSAGQQMNLFGLVGHLRGFGDPATLEQKIDEVAARLLGQAGIDYVADLRPWLGAQIAIAVSPAETGSPQQLLLLAAVKDPDAARTAVPRLFASLGVELGQATIRGHAVMTSEGTSYALLDDLLLVASTPDRLRAALDAEDDVAPSLADLPAFLAAMREVAADHLASVYVDLPRAAGLSDADQVAGYGTVALGLTAEADGLHLRGAAPFAGGAASEQARDAFALASQSPTITGWMPRTTSAEAVLFGLAQTVEELEATMAGDGVLSPAVDALSQLRLITGLGLGINLDRDLLPLFDGEAAVALQSLAVDGPHGQILLRPSDAAAAQAGLDRLRSALASRGARVTTSEVAGTTITSLTVAQIGSVAYAVADGVVILGRDPADVAAALEARAAGETLASDDRHEAAFELAGTHAGHEFWADVPGLVDALAGVFDPGSELRDILHQIGELAVSASAKDDRLEINGVLTVK